MQTNLTAVKQSLVSLRIGEREAAWAAIATARRLERTMIELGKATHEVSRLEGDLDELRARLGAADRDLERLRTDHDKASTSLADLEGDLVRSRLETAEAAQRLDTLEGLEQRLYSVVKERDRLSAVVQRGEQLEAELAALGRVHQELAAARSENATLRARLAAPGTEEQDQVGVLQSEAAHLRSQLAAADRRIADAGQGLRLARQQVTDFQTGLTSRPTDDRLIASEAARHDLELQLDALSATRSAERQASADRISGLERLHGEIAERDRRIVELEEGLDEIKPARDGALDGSTRNEAHVGEYQSSLAGDRPPSDTGPEAPTYADWDRTLRERVRISVQKATDRLRGQVDHLRLVIAEKERLLQERGRTTAATDSGPVPLTVIKGIGPVISAILAEQGVASIEDVAALSHTDIDRLGEMMPVYPGRIRHDDWVGQARALLGWSDRE